MPINNKPLSAKQALVLETIRDFINQKRYSPTTRELAALLGVTQTAALTYIRILEQKGKLTKESNKPRTILLVDESTNLVS